MECIVIDAGSSSVKAGYSGEDTPRVVFPAVVPDGSGEAGARRPEAVESHGASNHPVQRGVVKDWEKMEKVWDLTFKEELHQYPDGGGATTGLSVLLTEVPGTRAATREQAAQIMFETFKVPALCFFNSASLSLFASGRTRGMVLECGAGVSHAVPVFEGFALSHAVQRSENAGADVTAALAGSLARRQALNLNLGVVRAVKERLCFVASLQDRQKSMRPFAAADADVEYELPDGTTIKVPHDCRATAPEGLFTTRPNLPSVSDLVVQAIGMCDRDLQQDMRAAVVLAGGTTMLPGFCNRMKDEVVKAFPDDTIRVVPGPNPTGTTERGYNSQRKHAAWIGGSMFASLDTFKEVRVTKQEWEDDESTIHRKSF